MKAGFSLLEKEITNKIYLLGKANMTPQGLDWNQESQYELLVFNYTHK